MRRDFLSAEETHRRLSAAVERGEGERVDAPAHPYHGFIVIDEGIFWDPKEGVPHFNIQDLLQMVDLPVTPENVAIVQANIEATIKKYRPDAELVIVPDDPRITPYGTAR